MKSFGYGELGFYNIAVLFLVYGIGSFFSTATINKMGIKFGLVVGAIFKSLWVLACIVPAYGSQSSDKDYWLYSRDFIYPFQLIMSAICGIGNSMVWPAQGKYIADCANEETKGFFYGYFWAFYMSSQIIGNIIGASVLGAQNSVNFFYIMASLGFLASFLFIFLKKPFPTEARVTNTKEDTDTNELILSSQSISHELLQIKAKRGVIYDIKAVWYLLISKRMLTLIPQLLYGGIVVAITTGMLVPIIVKGLSEDYTDEDKKSQISLLIMTGLGVGEITGALSIGFIIDKLGSKMTCLINVGLCIASVIIALIVLNVKSTIPLSCVLTFFWGFHDGSLSSHTSEMLGFQFDTKMEPFSIYNLNKSIMVFIFSIIQSFVNESDIAMNFYFGAVGILGFIMCFNTYFFDFKTRSNSRQIMKQ
ncbi:major facilitator superfamily protein [Stylonychia lemnae]|uniref:Major facilitator superfamily protein n=1 Tax=Stylonychia lemnae TaxID=5949 RepID=A0A078AJL3_STYLE|nr:major facilitator superfamily protein [Stylonychia lemnae]|eukprot:CDW82555.1 major facilitator superfamily protein [Stylonychia lemnae]